MRADAYSTMYEKRDSKKKKMFKENKTDIRKKVNSNTMLRVHLYGS